MIAFFEALETSAFGEMARSSVWLYPVANIAHVLGATLLVGAIVVFDILVLRRRFQTADAVSSAALATAATGLALLLFSAPILFAAETSALMRNPVFLTKMALLAVATANIAIYYARRQREGDTRVVHAIISASVWVAIVIAGRSIAYV